MSSPSATVRATSDETRAIHHRAAWLLPLGSLTVAIVMGLLGVLSACTVAQQQAAAPSAASTVAVEPMDMDDTQLAAQLQGLCDAHPGACGIPVTAANLHLYVTYACWAVAQTDPTVLDGHAPNEAAWQAMIPTFDTAVVASGRCS